MPDEGTEACLKKAAQYLLATQRDNGSWSAGRAQHREPSVYLKDVVITAQSLHSLILTGDITALHNIRKAIHFCSTVHMEEHDPVDLWAMKLFALQYSNLKSYKRTASKIVEHLLAKQKTGCWEAYPGTFNLTNYTLVRALSSYECDETMRSAINWFKKTKANDGIGWGMDENAPKSEYTFTANVLLSLVFAGEDPMADYLQTACAFLEKGQEPSGGWPSTKLTVQRPTIYATSLATQTLMLLSGEPFSNKVKKGIEFLMKSQCGNGGWPLVPGSRAESYTTYHAVQTIAFYKYLREMWRTPLVSMMKQSLKPQQLASYLYRYFNSHQVANAFHKNNITFSLRSKALGTTKAAVKRRIDIMSVLCSGGARSTAEVIDCLRVKPEYANLSKKSHMTQIKADLECLRDMHLIDGIKDNYFMVMDLAAAEAG